MRRNLTLLAVLAACSGPSGPSGSPLPSGAYVVTGPSPFAFTVVSATESRVVLDWTAGRVRGTLPVRDTADVQGDAYRIQWLGPNQGENYVLRFTASSCTGISISGAGVSTPWPTCTIGRP